MPSNEEAVRFNLHIVPDEEADKEELDQLTRRLFSDIRDLDVESVELVKEDSLPEGAKSMEAVTLGALAIAVLPTLLPKFVEFLQAWILRGEGRTVKIKTQIGDRSLEVEYSPKTMSKDDLNSLVDTLTGKLAEK